MTYEEAWLRLLSTLLLFLLLAALETVRPRRREELPRLRRWRANLLMGVVNGAAPRLLLPWLIPALVALQVEASGIGLLNTLAWPLWLEVLITLVALDLAVYWQHRLLHTLPWLWRLHRMHHTDTAVDVSTALRFHPLEILLSLVVKSAIVLMLGAPVAGVLLFEMLLNGMALFNHANWHLPERLDAVLRRLVVTPDMHRVHHSVLSDEHQRNFGFNLSCWDHFFRSYRAQPRDGHQNMRIGLKESEGQPTGSFLWLLKNPFRS